MFTLTYMFTDGYDSRYPNAQFFAEHGWLAISINYRLCNGGCVRASYMSVDLTRRFQWSSPLR